MCQHAIIYFEALHSFQCSYPQDANFGLRWICLRQHAKYLQTHQGSLTTDERELLRPRSLQRDGKTYVNYTADFLWLGHCKGKLATSLRLRGAALKAFVEVGTSAAVRAVLLRASRANTSGLREELGGRSNGVSHLNTTLEELKSDLTQSNAAQVKWQGEFYLAMTKVTSDWKLDVQTREQHWVEASKTREQEFQVALRTRDETWSQYIQMLLQKRDREAEVVMFRRDATHLQAMEGIKTSVLQELGLKFGNFILQLGAHVSGVVIAAVKEGLALKKAVTKRKTISSLEMPEEQRASSLEAGPLALGLSTMALEVFPAMSFYAWRKIRGSFGHHAKQERLQRFNLGESHAFYIEKPLLWAYSGVTVEGGGARYVYTQAQRDLLLAVFRKQLQTSSKQRKDGAPRPTESLEERAHRLDASLTNAERLMQWPLHVAEIEPQWNEM